MHTNAFRKMLLATTFLGSAACLTFGASAANAQTEDGKAKAGAVSDKIETITVTAMKQGAQMIQDVPASIGVLGGDRLEALGITQVSDFAGMVAGLNIADNGPGDKRYIIRGINSAGEAQTAVYYDNIPTTGIGGAATDFGGTQPDLGLYDVQQIEVLRGPQGTLYGSNSQSGVIHFVTNKPDVDAFGASGQVDLSSTKDGGDNFGARGMVNIPLIEGKLALRVVAYREHDAGYIDNPLRGVNNFNDYDNDGVRASLKWQIDDKTSLLGQYFYQDMKSGGRSVERPFTEAIYTNNFPADGERKVSLYSFEPRTDRSSVYALTFDHDFNWADLTISSSYYKRDLVDNEDYTTSFRFFEFLQSVGAFPIFPIPAGGMLVAPESSGLWSTEARMHTSFDGPVNGVFGVYYSDRSIDYLNDVYTTGVLTGAPDPLGTHVSSRKFRDKTKDLAFFGEATWQITDALSVTGGVRWFDTERNLNSETLVPFFGMGVPGIDPPQHSDNKGTIFKGLASYKITPDAMVYAEYAEGFRSGGTNASTVAVVPPQYSPDYTTNYEVGAKTSWFDGRLLADVAVYKIDLSDLQVAMTFGPGGAFSGVGNLSGSVAESTGFEADITAHPIDGLTLQLSGNYTQASLTKTVPELGIAAIKGADLLNVPNVNLSFSADYSFEVADGYTATIGGVLTHTGSVKYHRYDEFNLPTTAYTLVNLRAGIQWENYDATLYVNNVADENAQVNVFNDVNDAYLLYTNQPRTIGLRLSAHW